MRRKRNNVVNLTIFAAALMTVLYLNLPANQSHRPFSWTTIRYKSTSSNFPLRRGRCPGLSDQVAKPVLVVARISSEHSLWLNGLASQYHICQYTADAAPDPDSVYLQIPANRGHESMAYLTFIIDNYDTLPGSGIVFVHGSRFAWHNDDPLYDNLSLLEQLNVTRALRGSPGPSTGYWNLRCDWAAGTCDANSEDGKLQGSLETKLRAVLEPGNQRAASDAALGEALVQIFGQDDKALPTARSKSHDNLRTALGRSDAVRSQCCAQFVVARENILQHSKEEYIALRQWLLDTSAFPDSKMNRASRGLNSQKPQLKNPNSPSTIFYQTAFANDLIAGRVLSYIWHILFLPVSMVYDLSPTNDDNPILPHNRHSAGIDLNALNTLACPRASECYCRLYGRCDLAGCTTPGHCRGQYMIPPGYKLPPDWAEKHT